MVGIFKICGRGKMRTGKEPVRGSEPRWTDPVLGLRDTGLGTWFLL